MRNLLQDTDRERLVAPLAGSLLRSLELGGRRHRALADGEASQFLPAEANAQAAELLLLPGLRDAKPELADQLLDFAIAMADAPLPCRRAVAGTVELTREDPRDVVVLTPFWRLTGDLSRGELRQELRGGKVGLRHSGNMVEFRAGRFFTCADVEDSVVEQSVEHQDGRVLLRHVSAIRGKAGWLHGAVAEVGRLSMTYEVAPGSPVLRVTASFRAARRLERVRITTAADGLDEAGLGATAGKLLEQEAWVEAAPPAAAGSAKWADGRPVAQLALGQAGWPASAPVLQIRLLDPARLMSVTAEARRPGAVHWLVLRHGFVTLAAGETLTVSEERLLGPEVAPAILAAGMQGLELDPAAPSGAVLQAVASALQFDAAGAWRDRMEEARRAALSGFALRQLGRIEAGSPGGLDLAYAALAADALRRAGVVEDAVPARLAARLSALVDDGGVLRAPDASLAAQAVAALAFARLGDGGAVARLLGAVTPGRALGFAGGKVDAAAEAEGVALLARAAGAAVLAAEAGLPIPPEAVDRGKQLHRAAVNLLRPLVQPRGPVLAVVGPRGVTPGLQALATMALLAPERLVFGAPQPSRATA